MTHPIIAFVGGGHMARALIAGLLRQGQSAACIRVGEPDAAARSKLQADFGVSAWADNTTAIAGAQRVVLAVKPQEMRPVIVALEPQLRVAKPALISIAAGITTGALAAWVPGGDWVRAMPNRAALVGAGVSALYATPATTSGGRAAGEQLLNAVGRCVWVSEEAMLDVVTALSGSGPAYFFSLAEQLAAAGRALGLEPDVAGLLAAETLYGAGQLAHLDADMEKQRAAVTSKGGTTAAALAELERGGWAELVHRAVAAASRRSAELSAAYGQNPRGEQTPR